MSLRTRIIVVVTLSCILCTSTAVLVARKQIEKQGEKDLIAKSRAILSRLEVGRSYVANMNILPSLIEETKQKYPDGKYPEDHRAKILRAVPVYAAFQLGKEGASDEHYTFRVAALNPRNSENKANGIETQWLSRFQNDRSLKEIVEKTPDSSAIQVIRPVRLNEPCLTCHGKPETSPWGNGKDILGIPMENMAVGDLKGLFVISSNLSEVMVATERATSHIALFGGVFTFFASVLGIWIANQSTSRVAQIAAALDNAEKKVSSASRDIVTVSGELDENATRSAANLEEVAATIEEISSIVSRNAESAKSAAKLSEDCQAKAVEGGREFEGLTTSINRISDTSTRVSNITKIINDLAFQTNLLALNAAVEAARAGNQGQGFAVVAEEVRKLAQKSGQAAHDISNLIKESMESVNGGKAIVESSDLILKELIQQISTLADHCRDFSAASVEQAQAMTQLSKAANEIDEASQRNAEAAKRTLDSSTTTLEQTEAMSAHIQNLTAAVLGKAHRT